jgi:hypothetical protein
VNGTLIAGPPCREERASQAAAEAFSPPAAASIHSGLEEAVMRKLGVGMVTLTLGLLMTSGAPAQQSGDNATKQNNNSNNTQSSSNERTIRGVVSGVTVLGETMVNYSTHRAEMARASYITVLGSPHWGQSNQGSANKSNQDASDKNKDNASDKNKDNTSDKNKDNASDKNKDNADRSGAAMKHRANVYILAITPQTKVTEASSDGQEAARSAATAQFDRLELGDRVEVKFRPENAGNQGKDDSRHGRHRTFGGEAISISILPAAQHHDQGQHSSSDRSQKSGDQK